MKNQKAKIKNQKAKGRSLSFQLSKRKVPTFCLLLFAFCLLIFNAQAQTMPQIRVSAESVAQTDLLTLGDIAEVRAADSGTSERLRAIALGYAPSVGAVRELPRERLLLALTAAGFPSGSVRLEAPAVALIRRAAQTIAPERVREVVESATLAELRASGAVARLVRLDLPAIIEVPSGPIEVQAHSGGMRELFAPFTVGIEFWQTNRVVRRLSVTAQVEAFAPVVVAARDLPANVRLRKEDLTIEVRRLERPAALYVLDTARTRGTSVKRTVARGTPLTTDLLLAEFVIKPGDTVRIVTKGDRLQIMAVGEARAAGRIGDRIQVKNKQSGLLLQAVVVDEGLVSVVL